MAPKVADELKPLHVRRLKAPGRHAVGGVRGLYLNVTESGARQWVLRYTAGTKRREAGLGAFPEVGLAEARERSREYRRALAEGRDPIAERHAAREALRAEQARSMTFEHAARATHEVKRKSFRNAKHGRDWIKSVERHALPVIGRMQVADIGVADIVRVLQPIWDTKPETASRLRQRIEAVLAWATVAEARAGDNPARWNENLDHLLGKQIRTVKHHRALPWQEVGQFMADLRKRGGEAARALELVILTGARSGEVRGMSWNELDLDAKTWTVPAERIKAGRKHVCPLSDPALAILKARPDRSGLVFRAPKGGKLSDMALVAVCRRMGADCVPHGFRSSFKDWARSCTRYPDEASELQLAHVNSDATRAAYARDGLLPMRTRLMADWSEFLAKPRSDGSEVTSIGEATST